MTNPKFLIAGLVLFAAFSASAEAKLYKWVDEKGETHYGETIPPEYANRDAVQLDKAGNVVKKGADQASPGGRKTPEEQAAIDQRRRDKALLDTYSNESEIDLARDRNLQQVEARISSINMRLKSAQDTLNGHRKDGDAATKGGSKPVPKYLQEDLADDQAKVDRLQQELSQAQKEADSIKARYDADKKRYRELTSGDGK